MSAMDDELKERLTPLQYHVTQEGGTEYAGSGKYYKHHDSGVYHCICCNAPLFTSDAKYDSGSGWPSYWQAAPGADIKEIRDESHGMVRTELRCGQCDAHLGHLFDDGPRDKTGLRYCVNSASLDFVSKDD